MKDNCLGIIGLGLGIVLIIIVEVNEILEKNKGVMRNE